MAATVHGSVNFGLVAESGLYVASVDFDIKSQEKWIPDEDGDDVAGALFNVGATFSMNGVRKTGEELAAKVGAAIVMANVVDFTKYIDGYVSGGLTYLNGIKPSLKNNDFETIDCSGGFKPFVSVV